MDGLYLLQYLRGRIRPRNGCLCQPLGLCIQPFVVRMTAPLTSYNLRALASGNKSPSEERRVSLMVLCGLALVIGVMTGLGAVGFRALSARVHNWANLGRRTVV